MDLADEYEIEWENGWDDGWEDDTWAARHPADEPEDDTLQPVVVIEKMSEVADEVPAEAPAVPAVLAATERSRSETTSSGRLRPFRCDVCQARFTAKQTLMVHMRRHTGEMPYACRYCAKAFRHSSTRVSHERQHVDGTLPADEPAGQPIGQPTGQPPDQTADKPYECEACQRRFQLAKSLAKHRKVCNRPHRCSVCPSRFQEAVALAEHEMKLHGIVPPPSPPPPPPKASEQTVCFICDKRFASSNAMWAHYRFHAAGGRFRCRQCPAHFSNWKALRTHLGRHTKGAGKASGKAAGALYKCKHCSLRFASRSSLLAHLKTHDRQQGGNLYVRCSECLERFAGRKSLWAHLKTHKKAKEEPAPETQPQAQPKAEPEPEPEPEPAPELEPISDRARAEQQLRELEKHPPQGPQESGEKTEKVYACLTCPLVFQKYWSLWFHRKNTCPGVKYPNYIGKWHNCTKCDLRFKTKKNLKRHSQVHEPVKTEPVQQSEVQDVNASNSGEQNTSPSKPKGFRCSKCSLLFPDRKTLHLHSKTHSGAMVVMGVDEASFEECNSMLDSNLGSQGNESISSSKVKVKKKAKFQCGKCPLTFRSRKSHWIHFNASHYSTATPVEQGGRQPADSDSKSSNLDLKIRAYRCRKCSEVFPDKKSQMVHHEKVHSGGTVSSIKIEPGSRPSKVRCAKCLEMFPDRKSHWWHFKEHLGAADGKVYELIDLDSGNDSIAPSETVLNYQCRKCTEVFENRVGHWWHFRVHFDQEDPEDTFDIVGDTREEEKDDFDPLAKYFRCKKCPEIFPDEDLHWQHFKEHMNSLESIFEEVQGLSTSVNGNEKRTGYRCKECPETFPDERSHWLHYKVHANDAEQVKELNETAESQDGISEYRCGKCPNTFSDLDSHWWHYRSHYGKMGDELFDVVESDCETFSDSSTGKQYRCLKCSEIFPDVDSHWQHFRIHFLASESGTQTCEEVNVNEGEEAAESKIKSYRCVKCQEVSEDISAHWWHYKTHLEISDPDSEPLEVVQNGQWSETHPRTQAFRCIECSEIFPDPQSHWWHFKEHKPELSGEELCHDVEPESKMFPCPKCPEVFPDRRSRFLHSAVHVTARVAAQEAQVQNAAPPGQGYQCAKCMEIFLDRQSHWWHYRTVHCPETETVGPDSYLIVDLTDDPREDSQSRLFHCSKCPKVFPDRKGHFSHYKAAHSDTPPAVAVNGDMAEAVAKEIPIAATTTTPKIRTWHCSKCPEIFHDRRSHFVHYKTHSGGAPAAPASTPAEEGAAVTIQAPAVSAPNNVKTTRKCVKCSRCAKAFPTRKLLWAHFKQHNKAGGNMLKAYRCTVCPEWFSGKALLWQHKKIHCQGNAQGNAPQQPAPTTSRASPKSPNSPPSASAAASAPSHVAGGVQCSKCLARFSSRSVLWAHIKTHKMKEKMYACEVCGVKFNARGHLRAHAEQHRKQEALALAQAASS